MGLTVTCHTAQAISPSINETSQRSFKLQANGNALPGNENSDRESQNPKLTRRMPGLVVSRALIQNL